MNKRCVTICLIVASLFVAGCTDNTKTQEQEIKSPGLTSKPLSGAGFSNVYRSRNGGLLWEPFASGIPEEATVSAFHIKNNTIYAATDAHGIYGVKSGESTWKRIDELSESSGKVNVDINAITSIENVLVIGTLKDGILISVNNGRDWQRSSAGTIRSLITVNKTLLAGSDNGILKSTDYGNTWVQVYKGGQVNGFSEMDKKIYAAVVNGAVMSNDDGESWNYIYQPRTLHDISNDGKYIYGMTLGAGLLRSKDDGLTWEDVNNGLGTLNLYTFDVKIAGDKLFAAQWYGIYASKKDSVAWSIISDGLPDSTAFTTMEAFGSAIVVGTGLRN